MEKKEYLNEEWYQNAKKKVKKIALFILIAGLLIGSCIIGIGVVKQNEAKRAKEQRYNEAQERLVEIAKEKEELNTQIEEKSYECDSMDKFSSNWFAESSKCNHEEFALRGKLADLEMEENELQTIEKGGIIHSANFVFYFIGAFVILSSLMLAFSVYSVSMRREVIAFTTQQVMPVAQEGIEKMTPTVSNSVGEIAKSIASGIKAGINEADANTQAAQQTQTEKNEEAAQVENDETIL